MPNSPSPRRRGGLVSYWALIGLTAAALVGGGVTVGATARTFTVPSASMDNTARPGDLVVVDRTPQVHRGDVIVELQPSAGPGYFIRRVIGLPGDHVACCDARGRITVNSEPLDETYLYPADAPSVARFNITVPAGRFWLLGDHRSVARDSRIEGPLTVQVVGRVFMIIRSGHAIFLRTPDTFIASGLAPAASQAPPALIGVVVVVLAVVLHLALSIFGLIRYILRRRGRSDPPEPQSSFLARPRTSSG